MFLLCAGVHLAIGYVCVVFFHTVSLQLHTSRTEQQKLLRGGNSTDRYLFGEERREGRGECLMTRGNREPARHILVLSR
jgi:hypothetical protein